ncbi:hypothetical protein K523DRAFT_331209 [Schizophyllum commune Tattone D]|nr:hypothetical protein K523DRAFT_331209 [Schizophyllum commune Tattone D]
MISRKEASKESVPDQQASQHPALEPSAHQSVVDRPMDRVPHEILALIFQFCVARETSLPNQFFHNTAKSPWLLTRVCGRWRELACKTPSLWTTIRISVDALEESGRSLADVGDLLRSYLQRSWPLPLSITVMSEDSFPAHILEPIVETCERWHYLFLFAHPDDFPRFAVIRGHLPALQSLQVIPTRIGEPTDTTPTMFEIAPKLNTLSLGGHALELNFALPWKQIRVFEANYIDPADVLRFLPLMPALTDLKLGREPPEHTPGPTQGIMITLARLRALTLNVSEGQRSPAHPGDLLDHLTLPALDDLEVECDVEESIETLRRLIERSDCRIETLTLVVTFKCRGNLLGLFRLTPHLQRLTLFDGTSMTEPRLLDALVVRPEDPWSVLLPKLERITLLASTPLPEEDVLRWLDAFESRVNPPQPQDEDGEEDEARHVHSLRGILMGCTSGENIVDNKVCLDRFNGIKAAGVSVDLCCGPGATQMEKRRAVEGREAEKSRVMLEFMVLAVGGGDEANRGDAHKSP